MKYTKKEIFKITFNELCLLESHKNPFIIKMKERNWMKLKNWRRKWGISKDPFNLTSHLSLFQLNSNIMQMQNQNEGIWAVRKRIYKIFGFNAITEIHFFYFNVDICTSVGSHLLYTISQSSLSNRIILFSISIDRIGFYPASAIFQPYNGGEKTPYLDCSVKYKRFVLWMKFVCTSTFFV